MHPVTGIHDPVKEQDFQIAQAKAAVTIGWFGNVLVILISIWIAVNEVNLCGPRIHTVRLLVAYWQSRRWWGALHHYI